MPFLCCVLLLVCINHVFFTTFYFGAFSSRFSPFRTNFFYTKSLFENSYKNVLPLKLFLFYNFKIIFIIIFLQKKEIVFLIHSEGTKHIYLQTFTIFFPSSLCVYKQQPHKNNWVVLFLFFTVFFQFSHIFHSFL